LLGVVAFAALGPIALALTAWTLRHLARALVGGWRRYRAARLASRPPGPARAAVAANDSKLQTASGAQTKGAWGSASAAADYANDVKLPVEDPLGTPPVPPV
jgi:hypothetical protein